MKKTFELGDTVYSNFFNTKGFIVEKNIREYFDIIVALENVCEIEYLKSGFFCESRIVLSEKFYRERLKI